jgi:hypothetical protein
MASRAKQDVAVELFYDGAWNDLVYADEVLSESPITITRGNSDESQAPRPSSISLTLNNKADKFRTSNPMSPLYGKAGVNTPLRVSVGGAVRGYGEASSWACDQTSDFRVSPPRGSAWADVQAGGLLQRIGQWSKSVKSPLRLATEGLTSSVGYWPMEDPAGSLYATEASSGAQNFLLRGHSFGSQNSPPGGGTAVDAGTNPVAQFIFEDDAPTSNAGWQLNKVIYIDRFSGGGISDPILSCLLFNGVVCIFQVTGDTGEVRIECFGPSGTLISQTWPTTVAWTGKWFMMQLQSSASGGTVTIGASWRAIGDPSFVGVSATYSGVTSQPYLYGAAVLPGCSYGHLIAVRGFTDDLTSDARFDAFAGHQGERASYRFDRLCNENNVPHYVSDSFDDSQEMGPQGGTQTLAKNFEEIQTTDDGIVYDHRTEGRVFYLSLADRYNQAVALTLDAGANPTGMPSLPAEVNDDGPIHNIVTARQRDGGDFTAEDSTSSMGTQDPPNGRGEYRQDVNVNVADPAARLEQQAHWWLNRGTVDLPRFPKVTVDLVALAGNPAKVAEVEAVDIGSVIEIVNYRENTLRLYVIGYTETIGTHTRTITFTCAPDRQFDVGVLNGPGRLQARSTVTSGNWTAAQTSIALLSIDDNEQWRPGASTAHIMVEGEEIALGTIGSPSAPPLRTWTVTGCTRAVNGISKAHGGSNPVKVVDPIRLTLGEAS